MRIADIIARYADSNTTVVNATSEASGLANYFELPVSLGISTVHAPGEFHPNAVSTERVLVIQHVEELDGTTRDSDNALFSYGDFAQGVLFLSDTGDIARHSLIERMTEARREVVCLHKTDHQHYRVVMVIGKALQPEVVDTRQLRVLSEYRCMSFEMRDREQDLAESRRYIAQLNDELESLRRQHAQAVEALEKELVPLRRNLPGVQRDLASTGSELARERAALKAVTSELQSERNVAQEFSARSTELERKLSLAQLQNATARNSASFRIGRATKLAFQDAPKNLLGLPQRWISVYRERRVLPPPFHESPSAPQRPPAMHGLSDEECRAITRQHWLLDREPIEGPRPGIAGVVGPRLATELRSTTRFQQLEPNAWPFQLEFESPAFVLVTSCGLGAGGAWASFGTPGGRGYVEALVALAEVCRRKRTPLVYWDTVGSDAPRLGMPSALSFDMVYSVSPSRCTAGALSGVPARLLAPAVEPLLYNPIGIAERPPRSCLYVGGFDQRMGRSELESLRRLLTASVDFGLEIHDPHWGYQGQLAAALQFPDDLSAHCRRRGPAAKEHHHLCQAGLIVCASQAGGGDFVPWELLRAIASGGHVVAPSTATDDVRINAALTVADTVGAATSAIAALRERPRLDAVWQSAFAHILCEYSMSDRLRTIAADLGARGAVPREPRVKVIASETQRLSAIDGTHLLACNADNGVSAKTLADLEGLARLSRAEVIALATGGGSEPMYSHGTLPDGAITAVRIDALGALSGGDGGWDAATIAELVIAGAQVLVKRDSATVQNTGIGGGA
ncbi:MAG: hypothetical protein JRH20_20125 [Deltaproteobacteria bacterium]|nr:hypothetical protein [Deltaproteobacteria bacterium]